VLAPTTRALVIVHPAVGAVFPVDVPVVEVIHMVGVDHRLVSAPGAVGVLVLLCFAVFYGGSHDYSSNGLVCYSNRRMHELARQRAYL
jgi:hypothetical protein